MSHTLGDIANHVDGVLHGDSTRVVRGVAGIEDAGREHVAFLANERYRSLLANCRAAAVLVPLGTEREGEACLIEVENPSLAFSAVIGLFREEAPAPPAGIHPKAHVDSGATLSEDVAVSAFTVVEAGATVGARTILYPNVYVGHEARIGEDCVLYPGSFVGARVEIGHRVILQPHAVVGSDGFGYLPVDGLPVKVPQAGIVRVEDDVEIGACTTIDRARFDSTELRRGCKVDNLVQVAHNVRIGEGTCIAALTGIAGSTTIGRGVLMGGQVGVVGHINIADGVRVAAQSGLSSDIDKAQTVAGSPAQSARQYWKMMASMRKLPAVLKEFKKLREKVLRLEKRPEDDLSTG